MNRRIIMIIVAYFAMMLFAGAAFGFGFARMETTGNILWLLGGTLVSGLVIFVGYASRPKDGVESEALDLFIGDMSDPVQRAIILRIFIAAVLHGVSMSHLFINGDVAPVNIHDGIANAEWMTLTMVAAFCLSLLWIIYECWRFYRIDEFWQAVSTGPLATAGVVTMVLFVFWTIAHDLLGAPEISIVGYYVVYWLTAVGLMSRAIKLRG